MVSDAKKRKNQKKKARQKQKKAAERVQSQTGEEELASETPTLSPSEPSRAEIPEETGNPEPTNISPSQLTKETDVEAVVSPSPIQITAPTLVSEPLTEPLPESETQVVTDTSSSINTAPDVSIPHEIEQVEETSHIQETVQVSSPDFVQHVTHELEDTLTAGQEHDEDILKDEESHPNPQLGDLSHANEISFQPSTIDAQEEVPSTDITASVQATTEVEFPVPQDNIVQTTTAEDLISEEAVSADIDTVELSEQLESNDDNQEENPTNEEQPPAESQIPLFDETKHDISQSADLKNDVTYEIDAVLHAKSVSDDPAEVAQTTTSQSEELHFDDHDQVEVEEMPWESTAREQININISSNPEKQSDANLLVNTSNEQTRVDTLSDLNLKDTENDENIVENNNPNPSELTNSGNQQDSDALFPENETADAERMPWDTTPAMEEHPEIVQEPRTIENTLLPTTPVEIDIKQTNVPTEFPTEASANPHVTENITEKNVNVENDSKTDKNNFSFMDDDEDLLEDDDSFLDSDEDLSADLSTSIAESQPVAETNTVPGTAATHPISDTPVTPKISKYTPQIEQNPAPALPQAQFNNINRGDLQNTETHGNTNTPNYYQQPFTTVQNKYANNAQSNIENIRNAKKKSDAYDFPSDLLTATSAPVHARAVGIPKGQLGAPGTPTIGVPRARAPSATYNPLNTSAAPPPSLGGKPPLNGHGVSAPKDIAPPQNARRTSTTHYVTSPQLVPNNRFVTQDSPYSRTRATSIMSNNSNGSIPQPNNPSGTSRYAPSTAEVPSNTQLPNRYTPSSNSFQSPQIPPVPVTSNRSISEQVQPQNRYAPHSVTNQAFPHNVNAPPMTTANQAPYSAVPGMNQAYQPANPGAQDGTPIPHGVTPPMFGHGRKTSNLYTPNQSGPGSKYAPGVQAQYYPHDQQTQGTSFLQPQGGHALVSQNPTVAQGHTGYLPGSTVGAMQQPAKLQTPHGYNQPPPVMGASNSINKEYLTHRQFPLFHWGKSNKIVYGIPVDNSTYGMNGAVLDAINVVNYDHILKPSGTLKTYPGPLTSKTKKTDLEKWINEISANLPDDHSTMESLIWNILRNNLKGLGSYSEIANILFDTSSIMGFLSQGFNAPQSSLNATRLDPTVQLRVLALLQVGNCNDALNLALEYEDFTMALLVSSLTGKEKWSSVVESYLRRESSGYSDSNANLLSLLFQVYAGNSKNAISNMYSNAEHNAWAVANWRMIVASILMNLGSIPELSQMKLGHLPVAILEFLIEFGILLSKRGFSVEASVLFMIANIPLSFTPVSSDCDVVFSHIGVPPSPQSLMWSEVYEYIRKVNEPEFKGYPALLTQKMNYAFSLEEESLSTIASKYNDYIMSSIKLLSKRDAHAINLMNSTNLLTARINDSSTGWLGKPKLSSVWGQLDKSFNKYIGGDDINTTKKTPEKSVFDTYTPYSSNHSSMVDLGQQNFTPFQSHMNQRPPAALEQQPSLLPNNYSMEQSKRGTHHNFSEQSPFHQQGRIGDSLQGSPQRTFGNETKIPGFNVPANIARVHSEIFTNQKVATTSFMKQEPTHPSLKRSVTHDASKMSAAAVLTSDILDVGPPPITNRRTESKLSSPDPQRRSSNLSNTPDMLPPPRSRVPKAKTSTHQTAYSYAPQTENSDTLQNTETTTQESSSSIEPVILESGSHATQDEDTVIHTTPGKAVHEDYTHNKVSEEDVLSRQKVLDSVIPESDLAVDSRITEPDHLNTNSISEPIADTSNLESVEVPAKSTSSEASVLHNLERDEINEEVTPIVSEVEAEQTNNIHDVAPMNAPASTLETKTNHTDVPQTVPVSEQLPTTQIEISEELHHRTDYSDVHSLNSKQESIPETVPDVVSEPVRTDTQNGVKNVPENMSEPTGKLESHSSELTITSEDTNDHTENDEVLPSNDAVDNTRSNIQNANISPTPETEAIHPQPQDEQQAPNNETALHNNVDLEPTSPKEDALQKDTVVVPPPNSKSPQKNSTESAPPPKKEEPYPAIRKPSVYAPSSAKPKTKRKVSSYLPANANALHNQLSEGVVQSGSEVDMFSYGGYHVTVDQNKKNEVEKPLATAVKEIANSPKLQEVQTFNVNQESQFKPQPFSNDRFGPIQNPDEISNEIFEPVIMKQPKNRFNTFTVAQGPEEFNDIIEEDSDEEGEPETKQEPVKKKMPEKKITNDDNEKSGWFGWLKNEGAAEKKAIKAKMGNANSFVFDPELKRWVNKNASEEDKKKIKEEATSLPPPPPIIKRKDTGPKTKPRASISHSNPPSGTSTPPTPQVSGPPLIPKESSVSDAPPMGQPSSSGAPPSGAPPMQSKLPSRNAPPAKTGSSLDDLLSMPKPGQTRRAKKKNNARYVNVLDQK